MLSIPASFDAEIGFIPILPPGRERLSLMLDIVNSALGVGILVGLILLYWLFRHQGDGYSRPWQQFFRMMLIGWAVLILLETVNLLSLEVQQLRSFSMVISPDVQWFLFRILHAAGIYWLINYIFRPQTVQSSAIPVAQIIMDWKGMIQGWNDEATNLLGWTAEEAIGQELAGLIIPDDLIVEYEGAKMPAREAQQRGMARFRESGAARILNTKYPTLALCKDGKRRAVEILVSGHVTASGTTFLGIVSPISALPSAPEVTHVRA